MKSLRMILILIVMCTSMNLRGQEPPERGSCRENTEISFQARRYDISAWSGRHVLARSSAAPTMSSAPAEKLKALIPAFQVNDNEGPCGSDQCNCDLATSKMGNTVIAWTDYRNGSSDVYVQIMDDSGMPAGGNIIISDEDEEEYAFNSKVGIDKHGNFTVTWLGSLYGPLMARRYSSTGEPLSTSMEVLKNDGSNRIRYPQTAVNDHGDFAVAWVSIPDMSIKVILSDPNGMIKTDVTQISEEEGHPYCCYGPSIAACPNGDFIITWSDSREGSYDIFAQIVDADGHTIGSNFKINTDGDNATQAIPSVAVCQNGYYLITWTDYRYYNQGNDEIHARIFSPDGTPVTGDIRVNDDQSLTHQYETQVISFQDSCFLVYWRDQRNGQTDEIYAQIYDSNGSATGGNFKIDYKENQVDLVGDSYYPAMNVRADNGGRLTAAFLASVDRSKIYTDRDVYFSKLSKEGIPVVDLHRINDDEKSASQGSPSIHKMDDGRLLIRWLDTRNGRYSQHFYSIFTDTFCPQSVDNQWLGKEYRYLYLDQAGHALGVNDRTDRATMKDYLECQYFNLNSQQYGTPFSILSVDGSLYGSRFSVALHEDGYFRVVWTGDDETVFCQKYDIDGVALSDKFIVHSDARSVHNSLTIAMNERGEFVVFWASWNNQVSAKAYSKDGTELGEHFLVSDVNLTSGGTVAIWDASINNKGKFAVAWSKTKYHDPTDTQGEYYEKDVYAQLGALDGQRIGDIIIMDDPVQFTDQHYPGICIDEVGKGVLVWEDNRSGSYRIYGQRIETDGSLLGNMFGISSSNRGSQRMPNVILKNDLIYTTWMDNRIPGRGWDIYANIQAWDNPVEDPDPPTSEILCQNYPNPFNSYTRFHYTLQDECRVNLTVYNLLGRKVKTLIDKVQEEGTYTLLFTIGDLPSGVYFYRLKAGGREKVRRMVLTK